jgi:hypothetical protein
MRETEERIERDIDIELARGDELACERRRRCCTRERDCAWSGVFHERERSVAVVTKVSSHRDRPTSAVT